MAEHDWNTTEYDLNTAEPRSIMTGMRLINDSNTAEHDWDATEYDSNTAEHDRNTTEYDPPPVNLGC